MIRFAIILTIVSCTLAAKLHVVHEWRYIDYVWDCKEQKDRAIYERGYNRTKVFTLGVQKVPDGRVFVTTPALFAHAVPATLSTVSDKKGPGGPLLKPYPNWQWHDSKHCKGITNVWRTAVDACNRLWVVDSGEIAGVQICLPQLLAFDLRTDQLLKVIKIPNDISHSPRNKTVSRLTFPVVETEGKNCERTWVYMVDYLGGGLVIFDGSKMWRVDDDVFHPCPALTTLNIAGEELILPNGIYGLTPTPETSLDRRRFFFRPADSLDQYSVSVDDLRKSATANKEILYVTTKGHLPGKIAEQAFSRDGILFFGLIEQLAIACWNMNTPLDDKHVVTVAQDNETLQYAGSVRITRCPNDPSKETLWIMTNRFQKSWVGNINVDEINFRILNASVDSLVKGTKCQPRNCKKT